MKTTYSKFLVLLQFGTIGIMLLLTPWHFTILSLGFILSGGSVGLWALTHNPLGNFNIEPELKENCRLITTGIYRWIRHPMYMSVTLMMLGIALMAQSITVWILWLFLLYVLLLKARREESLWLSHDPCYLAYREATKYFIPYIL